MNEKEFDIQIRNLLQDAEENVSPRVWKGVQAGLQPKRPVVVPFWRWAAVGATAAAAVVAGFVFLKPAPVPEINSNPIISVAEAPQAAVPEAAAPAALQAAAPAKPAVVRKASAAPVRIASVAPVEAAEITQEVPVPQEIIRFESRQAIAPAPTPKAGVSDLSLLNRLAFSEHKAAGEKGWSLLTSANIQSNQRSQVGTMGFNRPYAAPPLNAGEGIYNESPETSFSLPFSLGVGVKFNITPRWALGTGIRYTNLNRTFVGDYVSSEGFQVAQTDIDNHQHWLGIPLNLYYDVVNRGRWRVHTYVGGSAEWLVDNDFLIHNSPKDIHYHQHGILPQWSASGGLGVEFKLTPLVGLYLDPSFRYYFDTGRQPRSLRTIQPLRFDIEAGLRFSFGAR